jgi:hypothetical protein
MTLAAIAAIVAAGTLLLLSRYRDRDETSYTDLIPSGGVQRTVTLVHGTWPRGPFGFGRVISWYSADSILCGDLYRDGQAHTLISRHKWSGANSVSAREAAADDLKPKLRALFQKYPHAVHFVIAHSHGAAVVLRALQDQSIASRIAGIICLSTPFIRVSLRPWAKPQLSPRNQSVFQLLVASLFIALAGAALYGLIQVPLVQP